MSYRIEYAPESCDLQAKTGKVWTLLLMSLTVFALFLFCVRSFRPDDWVKLQGLFWPGDAAVTRNAAEILIKNIQAGLSVTDAAAAFCREIMHHAGIR